MGREQWVLGSGRWMPLDRGGNAGDWTDRASEAARLAPVQAPQEAGASAAERARPADEKHYRCSRGRGAEPRCPGQT